jgi:hypothetical protein
VGGALSFEGENARLYETAVPIASLDAYAEYRLVLVGLLIIVSDTFDAIEDGLSGWNVVTIVLGVFLLVSGLIGLRRTTN